MPVTTFADSDLVYVDPHNKKVIGPVEWLPSGKAKAILIPDEDEKAEASSDKKEEVVKDGKKPPRRRSNKKRYYPWCSYKTAKHVYHVEGKQKSVDINRPLDEIMKKAVAEPYWN